MATTQARTVRTATSPPPSSGLMYTRPWRSSPLAGPVFSTLPPIISESSQEDLVAHESLSRSPSSLSIVSAFASGIYGSRNVSESALAEVNTSSSSLPPSTSAHGTATSSSQGHGSSQTHPIHRPARLTKSWGRPVHAVLPKNTSEASIVVPPPRARTVSHGHTRPASLPTHFVVPPSIPLTYSPHSDPHSTKHPPSMSRDPASNWMSSTPFGPAAIPKFSRLAMASPTVVMPLSAREYRKRKAKEVHGKERERDVPHVAVVDNAMLAFQTPNGVPPVKPSFPRSEGVHHPSSGDHNPPQSQDNHPLKHVPHVSLSAQPRRRPSRSRPRSRPTTPPQSSPLAAHPPISPKSSSGTFFSLASAPDDDMTALTFPSYPHGADDPNTSNLIPPPPRPRQPRPRRRKSHPDRLSNGTRLSLLEAMNRLSQESAALHRLSGLSQTDGANRLSVVSQASNHTVFYDVVEVEGEIGDEDDIEGGRRRSSLFRTQSLEDLSSTLVRTGIAVAHPHAGDYIRNDEPKGKRNVRVVRISDTVEVSPPPVHRRRKLTKSRPWSTQGAVKVMDVTTGPQLQERRTSLLPWKSKGSSDSKGGVISSGAGSAGPGEKGSQDGLLWAPINSVVGTNETATPTSVVPLVTPTLNGPSHLEADKNTPFDMPTAVRSESSTPIPPRKARRYTFSFLPSSTFSRLKRDNSNAYPASADLSLDRNIRITANASVNDVENGTESTSTSIHTIIQASESTPSPTSSVVYDLTTLASSGGLSGAGRGTNAVAAVPMLRRLNAQEIEMESAGALSRSEWKGSSTPSLITNGSTATTSSSPRTPSLVRLSGVGAGEQIVLRPSGLKESFADMSEDDSDGAQGGRSSQMGHQKLHHSPLAHVGTSAGETLEEDERINLHASSSPGLLSPSPRHGSRPGTSSSTLTTATETSGTYASFSTGPSSTISSSSTSRSTSPSLVMGEKRDRLVSVPKDIDEDLHGCVMCGHVVSLSTSPASLTHDLERAEMHPMFMVPLVTVPASAMSNPRSTHNTRLVGRDVGGVERKGERQLQLSKPVATAVGVGAKYDSCHDHLGKPITRTGMTDKIVSPSATLKKHRRPQTAPAGNGDVAFKWNDSIGVGADRASNHKGRGSVQSRFKAVLKGLLRWNQ